MHPVESHNYVPERELGALTKQQCTQQQIKTETTQPLCARCEPNTDVCISSADSRVKDATNTTLFATFLPKSVCLGGFCQLKILSVVVK